MQYFGHYSERINAIWGHSIWTNTQGVDVKVTCVSLVPDLPQSTFEDLVYVGELVDKSCRRGEPAPTLGEVAYDKILKDFAGC